MFLLSLWVGGTSVWGATDVARRHVLFFWPIATNTESHLVGRQGCWCCCCCCGAPTLHILNHPSTGEPWLPVYHPAVKSQRQPVREMERRSVMAERALQRTHLPLIWLPLPQAGVFSPLLTPQSLTGWVSGQPACSQSRQLLFLSPFAFLRLSYGP